MTTTLGRDHDIVGKFIETHDDATAEALSGTRERSHVQRTAGDPIVFQTIETKKASHHLEAGCSHKSRNGPGRNSNAQQHHQIKVSWLNMRTLPLTSHNQQFGKIFSPK